MDYDDIRASVRKLCEGFPGEYWRRLDCDMAYPRAFVDALTESGFLAALIPEADGGAGLPLSAAAAILEEIQASGCNGASCHAQMYVMGTVLRHGSEAQKQKYLPGVASGALRLQAFGVTEPTSGTDTTSIRTFARKEGDRYVVNGQKVWTSRAEYSDLMVKEALRKYEEGEECGAEANMAKMLAADASFEAANAAIQTHGGFGFAEEFDIERKFRETRLYQVAPISTNLILSYLAEHVLGLPRSY
jgi:alkylation response protein AidB-like acyl-CoA dehydrogenase